MARRSFASAGDSEASSRRSSWRAWRRRARSVTWAGRRRVNVMRRVCQGSSDASNDRTISNLCAIVMTCGCHRAALVPARGRRRDGHGGGRARDGQPARRLACPGPARGRGRGQAADAQRSDPAADPRRKRVQDPRRLGAAPLRRRGRGGGPDGRAGDRRRGPRLPALVRHLARPATHRRLPRAASARALRAPARRRRPGSEALLAGPLRPRDHLASSAPRAGGLGAAVQPAPLARRAQRPQVGPATVLPSWRRRRARTS